MERERLDKYQSKLQRIQDRLNSIEEWMENVSKNEFSEELQLRLSVYKAIQEVSEAVTDLCAMYLSDRGKLVGDSYENISATSEELFPDKLEDNLKNLNGLRNRIVHEYDKIDHNIAFNAIKTVNKPTRDFKEEVEKWIKNK